MPQVIGGIVYEPDLRLVAGVRKLAVWGCKRLC